MNVNFALKLMAITLGFGYLIKLDWMRLGWKVKLAKTAESVVDSPKAPAIDKKCRDAWIKLFTAPTD